MWEQSHHDLNLKKVSEASFVAHILYIFLFLCTVPYKLWVSQGSWPDQCSPLFLIIIQSNMKVFKISKYDCEFVFPV